MNTLSRISRSRGSDITKLMEVLKGLDCAACSGPSSRYSSWPGLRLCCSSITSAGELMAEYEFTAEENRVIDQVRRKLQHIAVLFLLLGVLQLIGSFLLTDPAGRWISVGSAILLLALGWLFWRPLDNFRRIISTEGQDIREVVTAIKDLRSVSRGRDHPYCFCGRHHHRNDASDHGHGTVATTTPARTAATSSRRILGRACHCLRRKAGLRPRVPDGARLCSQGFG